MRQSITLIAAALTIFAAGWATASLAAQDRKPAPAKAPAIAGAWTGSWGPYSPDPNVASRYTQAQKQLDCTVETLPGGKWQATFEGECGRPYKYTIKLEGRTAGGAALFQGSVDLGEKDGGVYDWIGRATDKEFVGFYTSQGHVGHFRLTRAAKP